MVKRKDKGKKQTGRPGDKGTRRSGMKIQTHRELRVWQNAMDAAMVIFEETKAFPPEERYSLVDQMRKSSRSVAANISEAWRRRRDPVCFHPRENQDAQRRKNPWASTSFQQDCGLNRRRIGRKTYCKTV